ncbi:spermatogenesis-associated protein 22 [Amia ocellicauda]|uniref:spermatogenesis-associated protein 22 n=1 Tax=Amia ocellicauda TaxID=2972642 RepID=UPI003463AABE
MPHPGKTGNMGPRTGKPSANTKQSIFPNSSGAFPNKTNTSQAYPRAELQSFYSQPHPSESFQHRDLQRPRPGQPNTPASRPHHSGWKFTPNSSISQFNEDDLDAFSADHFDKPQKQPVLQIKPAEDNSLRVLTTVVEGMKHWSQYRDRAAFLFEIFATLDSAVTTGSHGAKNFLLRDGKHAVQCVFYETDRELPRLIRGQVHRCVGNYDRGRNLLKCVSVRAATLSEQRNSAGSVKASDAVMREFVKTCREV